MPSGQEVLGFLFITSSTHAVLPKLYSEYYYLY